MARAATTKPGRKPKPKTKAKPKPRSQVQRGRPTKFKPEFVNIARKMSELGATDAEMADAFEIDIRTLTRWKYEQDGFAEALIVGKDAADKRMEDSLYRRGVGYNFDSVEIKVIEGEVVEVPIRKHVPADTTAAIFWLKNRQPGKWRDTKNIKHDIEEDGPLERFMKGVNGNSIRPKEG
jgi:hypothetical protein